MSAEQRRARARWTEAELLRKRVRTAERSATRPSHTAKCEVCGKPCRAAHRDRFGYTPPTGCSSYCLEVALQKRAPRAEGTKGHGRNHE